MAGPRPSSPCATSSRSRNGLVKNTLKRVYSGSLFRSSPLAFSFSLPCRTPKPRISTCSLLVAFSHSTFTSTAFVSRLPLTEVSRFFLPSGDSSRAHPIIPLSSLPCFELQPEKLAVSFLRNQNQELNTPLFSPSHRVSVAAQISGVSTYRGGSRACNAFALELEIPEERRAALST